MGLLAAITALANAAARYLDLQILAYPDRLSREIEDLEDERDRLRDTGRPADALRADRLQQRIARRVGLAATLPAAGAAPSGRPAGGDDRRDLPTAGG